MHQPGYYDHVPWYVCRLSHELGKVALRGYLAPLGTGSWRNRDIKELKGECGKGELRKKKSMELRSFFLD